MLEQVQWIAKKLEYGAKILGWAARSLGTFPLPDKEEPKENRNANASPAMANDTKSNATSK